jgi:lysophospholipase L1-like esterase
MGCFAVDLHEMNVPRTVERMLVRRTAAVLALAALGALTGCDEGPPGASVGNPSASSTATRVSDLAYPTYVALGDSYTAAPGVPQTEQETGCLRSNGNYASLVANQLKSDFVDVSCTGASTVSLIGAQHRAEPRLPPQFAALSADTSLVTLGIGGNDLKLFETMVGTCGQFGLSEVGGRVKAALKGIHDRSPQARVVLVGYPQPLPSKGTCRILPLANGDYPYVRGLVVKLNDALRTAAKKAKADFIDMVKASKGHDICAGSDAWVNGVNTDLMRALAFHPFAEEQQAVADLIMKKLDVE